MDLEIHEGKTGRWYHLCGVQITDLKLVSKNRLQGWRSKPKIVILTNGTLRLILTSESQGESDFKFEEKRCST